MSSGRHRTTGAPTLAGSHCGLSMWVDAGASCRHLRLHRSPQCRQLHRPCIRVYRAYLSPIVSTSLKLLTQPTIESGYLRPNCICCVVWFCMLSSSSVSLSVTSLWLGSRPIQPSAHRMLFFTWHTQIQYNSYARPVHELTWFLEFSDPTRAKPTRPGLAHFFGFISRPSHAPIY